MKRNIADFLMAIDNDLWDFLGVQAGDEFRNADGSMNEKFDEYCKHVKFALFVNDVKKVSKKVYEQLEDSNYHTMNRALECLGMLA